jgi:two-component system sensor histidine kinase HydH
VEQTQENVELAEIALGQLLRLEKMLNELLQYGRPLEFSWECVNVGSLIKAAVDELEELSSEKRVEVNATVGADIGEIEVDVEQFKRVLVNLIRNAIEASPGDSGVEIHVRTSGGAAPDTVIDVIDMGGGIREEHLDMLFKPFFTTKSEGIGLGLANVKKIVGLHFGHIRVRNGHPCGAVFTITIPRQSPSKGTHLNS